MLKKATTILFLFIFLSANTVFGQLIKLPVLFQHYHEHVIDEAARGHHNDHGFLDFLADHYAAESNHSDKDHSHENLPFKHAGNQGMHSVVTVEPLSSASVSVPFTFLPVSLGMYLPTYYSLAASRNIWQPPRC